VPVQYQDAITTKSTVEKVFGHPVSEDDLAAMSGALLGDTVQVWNSGPDLLSVLVEGERIKREFTVERRGEQVILRDEYTGNLGLKSASSGADLIHVMKNMQRVGVTRIICTAARSDHMNGYYTWARLGFTGKIPIDGLAADTLSEMQATFGNISRIEQLMRKPGGAQWWKHNGTSWEATFSFKNRYSLRILTYFDEIVSRHDIGDGASSSHEGE